MNKVLFSILIPVYNVEKYIEECLDSVMNQTFCDFEAVIIDDGSTDKSGEICDQYARKDNRFRVFHQNNQGLMMSRKNALIRAEGEYCLFLDSDDYYELNLLERVNAEIQKNRPDMLIFNIFFSYKKHETIEPIIEQDKLLLSQKEMLEKFASCYKFNSVCTKVIRRESILSDVQQIYVPVNYAEDMRQSVFFILRSSKFEIINEGLYHYRIRKGSLIHRMSVERIEETLNVKNGIEELLQNKGKMADDILKIYRANTLGDFMDCVFRLNTRLNIPFSKRIEEIKRLQNIELVRRLKTSADNSKMPLYNKVRYLLLCYQRYGALLLIDQIILLVDKWRDRRCGQQLFE